MKKFLALVVTICSLALAVAAPLAPRVFADNINVGGESYSYDPNYTDPTGKLPSGNGNGENEVKERVKIVINILLSLVGIVSVIMIIWGGITYSYSAGDPSKAQLAKRVITAAIIGLILSIMAFVILNVVITVSQGGTL
jgi:hypothetical protein